MCEHRFGVQLFQNPQLRSSTVYFPVGRVSIYIFVVKIIPYGAE